MKSILITGGAGFVGSHAVLEFLTNNYKIHVLDSFINSSIKSLDRIKSIINNDLKFNNLIVHKGDLRDKVLIQNIFRNAIKLDEPIKGVIHLAGLKSVKQSILKTCKYWDINVAGTINLIQIMEEFNCFNLVFSSSATVYGFTENKPFKEDSILNPINPYGMTKMVVEKLLSDIFINSNHSWRIANLRYFNPIGAHTSGKIGESSKTAPENIFPLIVNSAIDQKKELILFGNDWPTRDGTPIRDFIHVMDVAQAHYKSYEYLLENKSQCITINIGTGEGTSVLELVKIFESANKVKIPFRYSSRRKGDTPYIVADNKFAQKILGWEPKRNIYQMCKDGWKWKVTNPNGYF